MATATLRPNADLSGYSDWTLVGTPDPNTHAGALADENQSTFIKSISGGDIDRHEYDDPPAMSGVSGPVTVSCRVYRTESSGDIYMRVLINGQQLGGQKTLTFPGATVDVELTDAAWTGLTEVQLALMQIEWESANIPSKKNMQVIRSAVSYSYTPPAWNVFRGVAHPELVRPGVAGCKA